MSLNWEFKDKEKFEAIKGDTLNDAFIWGCLIVGIGEITEKNAEEWYVRYSFADAINGPYNHKGSEIYRVTLEDTKKRIGLRTNVFPKKTEAQFLKNVFEIFKSAEYRRVRAEETATI